MVGSKGNSPWGINPGCMLFVAAPLSESVKVTLRVIDFNVKSIHVVIYEKSLPTFGRL